MPARDQHDRFRGCLLGLAAGDAVGMPVQFRPRGSFPPLTDMVDNPRDRLPAGAWTDDTSMALCLATSLLERDGFDPLDQMQRYHRWFKSGYLSSTGYCFDLGRTVEDALLRFEATGEPLAGSTDPRAAGNGCTMRLAPVPMFFHPDLAAAIHWSAESSRTTHGARECLDACRLLGAMVHKALAGGRKDEILFGPHFPDAGDGPLAPKIQAIADGAYRDKSEDEIVGSGYVVPSLEAALWCFLRTDDFRAAILRAANLGDDADTTAAICGQLAGAQYGESGIPPDWLGRLVRRDLIADLAERLWQASARRAEAKAAAPAVAAAGSTTASPGGGLPADSPAPGDLFDRIRAACAEVAGRARFVRIDLERLARYAAGLPAAASAPGIDPATHWLGRGEETVAFFLTLDAINFGSGWFPVLRKRPGMSGYFTVASSLRDAYARRGGPLTASELATVSPQECAAIFGQAPTGPAYELMRLFARALNDLGRLLVEDHGGRFGALVEQAGGSAGRLVASLARMPLYRDVARYDDLEVPFYKRAQITAADLALALDGAGTGRFSDLDRLTIFADNLVPHVLRIDGVLTYEQVLARRIDAEELIPPGSHGEIEIRASALHAVELIRAELARLGRPATSVALDYLLWTRGQEPAYKRAKPRHRTRTTFY
jgi:ADP-ribosyl-[dinitrogen reductase] hydrolase